MPAGRPPKPVEQKRRLGNPGKRALPVLSDVSVLPMAGGVPEPPAELGLAGRDLWARAWGEAITWVSPDSDWPLVVAACVAADAVGLARERYFATRDTKDLRGFIQANEQLVKMLAELGFTPVSRSRLGVAEVKKANALDELLSRRAERRS